MLVSASGTRVHNQSRLSLAAPLSEAKSGAPMFMFEDTILFSDGRKRRGDEGKLEG